MPSAGCLPVVLQRYVATPRRPTTPRRVVPVPAEPEVPVAGLRGPMFHPDVLAGEAERGSMPPPQMVAASPPHPWRFAQSPGRPARAAPPLALNRCVALGGSGTAATPCSPGGGEAPEPCREPMAGAARLARNIALWHLTPCSRCFTRCGAAALRLRGPSSKRPSSQLPCLDPKCWSQVPSAVLWCQGQVAWCHVPGLSGEWGVQ